MTEDRIDGAGEGLKGKVKEIAGKLTDNPSTQVSGQIDQAKGKLQDAYGQGQEKLQGALEDIVEYTKSNPWLALGAALGTGLLLGHASGRSKRKVVYVQRVKPSEVK